MKRTIILDASYYLLINIIKVLLNYVHISFSLIVSRARHLPWIYTGNSEHIVKADLHGVSY